MWIAIFVGTVLLLWNSKFIMAEKKCSKSNFQDTLGKPDAILYGMREDGAVLFATIADILAIDGSPVREIVRRYAGSIFCWTRKNGANCAKVQLLHILYQFIRGNVIYFITNSGEPSVASSDKALARKLKELSNSLFSSERIPTSFVADFLLLRDRKGLFTQYSMSENISQPSTFKVNEDIRFLAIYDGFLFSGSNEGQYKCVLENECEKGGKLMKEDVIVAPITKAADEDVFAAFTDRPPAWYESGSGQRNGKECPLTKSPYFVQLMLKVMLADTLMTLALIIMVLVHRMHIIPARRRYKIVTQLLKRKKKRALKDRAERRLRRLNFLKRKLWGAEKKDDSSSSTVTNTRRTTTLVTAAENMTTNENVTFVPPTTTTATHAQDLTTDNRNQSKATEA